MKIIYLILLFAYNVNSQTFDENTPFINTADLSNRNYVLSWNFTETDITFKVVAATSGWVGFGLSPNGAMENSDMVLAWTSTDGTMEFRDAHTENAKAVLYDQTQNWRRLFYSVRNGVTTMIFTRALVVCNPNQAPNEINIDVLPVSYVIYAWGTNFAGNVPSYHGQTRGSRSLPILGAINQKVEINMNEIETADFKIDTILPNAQETTYFCSMFKLPTSWIQKKKHIVRTETLIRPENLKYVHHWLMYECSPEYESVYLKNNSAPTPGICSGSEGSTEEWGRVQRYCTKISLGWAVGGDLVQDFPQKFGYPVGGGEKEFKYFFLEMHYENPTLDQNVREDSAFRLYVTENYREIEFGIFTGGTLSDSRGIIVPQGAKNLNIEYMCRKDGINALIGNNSNITVFANLPHTHLAGRQVFSKIVRNGKEVNFISNSKYYDFNYQYTEYLQNPVHMFPGDEYILKCVYNTEGRTKTTTGGLGTNDEMCLNFVWYYPRNADFDSCYDWVEPSSFYPVFDNLNKSGEVNWQWNGEENDYFPSIIGAVEQSDLVNQPARLQSLFEDIYRTGKRNQFSVAGFSQYDPISVERMNTDSCAVDATTSAPMTMPPTRPVTVAPLTNPFRPQKPHGSFNPFGWLSNLLNHVFG